MPATATANNKPGNNSLPAVLNLEKIWVLIVGGGQSGLQQLREVLNSSPVAKIKVVAQSIGEEVKQVALKHANIVLQEKAFDEQDLQKTDLVIVAVKDNQTKNDIRHAAKQQGKLVNVAGEPEASDFHFGGAINNYGKTEILTSEEVKSSTHWKKVATLSISAFALMLIGHFIFSSPPIVAFSNYTIKFYQTLDANFPWMILAGFIAQLVDGALGMGYGITSSSILLSTGINPAAISGSIHAAEMFASGASGYSHYKFGNVNKKMFKVMLVPGVIGAILGAVLLVWLGSAKADYVRPVLAVYTLILGIRIIFNVLRKNVVQQKFKQYGWLAAAGGFLDSFGGGGWGPIVTTTLITRGRSPRFVIGSVSLTEFFVTLASAFTFFTLIGVTHWQVIVALIIGGLIAAPIAAKLAGKLPRKTSMLLLGVLVIIWSFRILIKVL